MAATFAPSDKDKAEFCETKDYENCTRLKIRKKKKKL
jgi:hypothetical protein